MASRPAALLHIYCLLSDIMKKEENRYDRTAWQTIILLDNFLYAMLLRNEDFDIEDERMPLGRKRNFLYLLY